MSKCPVCAQPFISHGGSITTLVGYMSPPGHDHDDNCLLREYRCANGHDTAISVRRRCSHPECHWVGKAVCRCHKPETKVDAWPEIEYA